MGIIIINKKELTARPKKMDPTTVDITANVVITAEDIDDIMSSALESGISYWCSRAIVVGKYYGDCASEQISRGGILILLDGISGEPLKLTQENFMAGLTKYLENSLHPDTLYTGPNGEWLINCGQIDGPAADMIIQLAVFGTIYYG